MCSFCKKGIKTIHVTEDSSVVKNIYDCGYNHELCMCPCTSNGNDFRFVNHSCHPNARLYKWHYQNKVALAIIAIEDIEAGYEVTFSYTDSKEPPEFMNKCLCDHCEDNLSSQTISQQS